MAIGLALSMSGLAIAATRFTRRRSVGALLFGAANGLGATYAGLAVPLASGSPIADVPVQAVIATLAIAGSALGRFVPFGRASPPLVAVAAFLSFAATVQAIAVLYPPSRHG